MPRLDAGSAGRGASTPLSSAAASHLHALCSQMMITMGESIVGLTVYNLKQAGPEPPPRTSVQMSVLSDPVRRPKRASTVTLREHRPLISESIDRYSQRASTLIGGGRECVRAAHRAVLRQTLMSSITVGKARQAAGGGNGSGGVRGLPGAKNFVLDADALRDTRELLLCYLNAVSLTCSLSHSLSHSHSPSHSLTLTLSHSHLSLSSSLSLSLYSLSHTHHKLALTLTLTHSPSVPCSLASKRRRPAEPPRAATDQGAGTRHNAQLRWSDTPPGKGRGSDPGAACRSRRGRCASGIYPGRRCAAATDSWSRYAAAAHTWSRCAAAAHTWSRCAAAAHTWSRCAAAANARSLEFPGPQLHR